MTPPSHHPSFRIVIAALAASALALQSGNAATAVWNNNGTDFNTGANWTGGTGPGGIPGTGDTAQFTGNENVGGKQPDLSGSLSILGVDFNSVSTINWDLTADSGQSLTLTSTSAAATASAVYGANTVGANVIAAPLILGAASGTQYILQASGGTLTLSGAMSVANSIVLSITSVSGTSDFINLSGPISSGANILLNLGKGNIALSGSNSYTGTTNAGDGTSGDGVITITNNNVFGTSTVNFSGAVQATTSLTGANAIANNAALKSSAAIFTGTNSIELSGPVAMDGHIVTNNLSGGGSLKISGNVALAGTPTIAGSGTTVITGNISGASSGFGITSSGSNGTGLLVLGGANTFDGATTITGNGAVSVSSINSVGVGGASSLGAPTTATNGRISLGNATSAGTLIYTGAGETSDRALRLVGNGVVESDGSGALNLTSSVLASQATSSTLTLQGSNTGSNTIGGVIPNSTVTTSVVKQGAGEWILGGVNTYTGTTFVNAGTLLINGVTAAGSAVALNGGILGGSGTAAGLVTTSGTASVISPGNGPGTLNLIGGLNASSGVTFNFELGTSADLLKLGTGVLTGSAIPDGLVFNFSNAGGLASSTPYTLITFGSASGLDYTDLLANTLPSGYALDSGFGTNGFQINGTDLQVQFVAVPEPGVSMLFCIGAAFALYRPGKKWLKGGRRSTAPGRP